GMQAAGLDTAALVRAGMIGFLEGAMLCGIFHGDLHGGNLFVLPDGRTALLDFGITGRLDEFRRRAFLRLLVGATVNDVKAEMAHIAAHFATAHGARISADVGVDPRSQVLDLSGVKASFGVDANLETLTYRDLQERRAMIRERLAKRDRKRRRP